MKTIYCDGWSLSRNPDPVGGGYTILWEEKGKQVTTVVREFKSGWTNNEAELNAIALALRHCGYGGKIITDSMTCIYWLRARRSRARPDLNSLIVLISKGLKQANISLEWQPRHLNLAGIYNDTGLVKLTTF